ncbi:UvrD-helicase domain-containing protein [Macromonas bipunctata]|uniref:UvrD-helicase domain-containing protein n=1 Tax=Macromonas bipunctata TaxID=183670 RepID=UPI000C335AC5|nr:UvrD-helicase domain-containing protein [Macromonas bipunctata]
MRILEYTGLDTHKVAKSYRKVAQAIAARDFRAAQVKKLGQAGQGRFYRARLDDSNRLLFTLVPYQGEVCALMLEVILNHDYDKSRFLRGATIDEAKIPDIDWAEAETDAQQAPPLRYLHPEHAAVHLLDKPISFDDVQEAIYREPAPLVVVGSAGSGKTALTLEKLKHAEGEVLYVTHSAFLAQSARDLYYANGFEHTGQEAVFLSYREFIETIHVPPGREALWRDFVGWFTRIRQAFKDIEAHQAFEEIRGVLAASAQGILSREAYRALGVRQSIFAPERRDALYDLFEKYRAWLAESQLFDLNLVAQDWLARAQPRYDFVVVDEVQDLTPVQLALVLKTLKKPGHFLLCGDSNQIVHPNFFSWAQVKSLFWQDATLAERQQLRVLAANFRNGHEATRVANQLLKIKQRRFGSIDRESNYLVQAVGGEPGAVQLLADKDADKKALNQQIRQSTQFAVLVMRDEDKAAARQHFSTPLLFSIHEAKGLEYDNIVLYRFVSDHRAEFADIVDGVSAADLQVDTLEYRRARDKQDKSLEVYKFFVNALYVALTRAVRNLYLIESDLRHPLFDLLEVRDSGQVSLKVQQSSLEDWQKEARKLELQGKQEQADAIRKDILKQATPPWPVFDQAHTEELMRKVFIDQVPGNKHKQQLLEIAACHQLPTLSSCLHSVAKFQPGLGLYESLLQHRAYDKPEPAGLKTLRRKSYTTYASRHTKDILRQCEQFGLEHRLPMNLTPLMAAAASGNVPLVQALVERGADREATDHFGCNALHWALREAFTDTEFATQTLPALYELLAPAFLDINTGERLVRIDRHLTEYFLLQTLWAGFRDITHTAINYAYKPAGAFNTDTLLQAWQHLPTSVLRTERRKRPHLNNVLSRNELNRDYAYNRKLFWRVGHGQYQFNPALSVRRKIKGEDTWVPLFEALNLRWLTEFLPDLGPEDHTAWLPPGRHTQQIQHKVAQINHYLEQAKLPPVAMPRLHTWANA